MPLHTYSRYRTDVDDDDEASLGVSSSYDTWGAACGWIIVLILASIVALLICMCMKQTGVRKSCSRSGKIAKSKVGVTEVSSAQHLSDMIASEDRLGCMFYAPWCSHCMTTKPEYTRAATMLEHPLCMVNCADDAGVVDASFMEDHGIRGFPTIVLFKEGRQIQAPGNMERTAEGIREFILSA